MRSPPRQPPRRLPVARDSNHDAALSDFDWATGADVPAPSEGFSAWFQHTYPGYTLDDLAEFYRRTKVSPPVIANPEQRYATFKMRMVRLAANYTADHEVPGTQKPRTRDTKWFYAILAVGGWAALILLAAAFATA